MFIYKKKVHIAGDYFLESWWDDLKTISKFEITQNILTDRRFLIIEILFILVQSE